MSCSMQHWMPHLDAADAVADLSAKLMVGALKDEEATLAAVWGEILAEAVLLRCMRMGAVLSEELVRGASRWGRMQAEAALSRIEQEFIPGGIDARLCDALEALGEQS